MKTVSKCPPPDRPSARRHSTSPRARSPFRRAISTAVRSESKPIPRPAPRSFAAIATTPFPHPRSAAERPSTSPRAEARYATSAAMPAGVGYCSVTAAGWGSGSRDSRIFSSRTFFVASPPSRNSFLVPGRLPLGRRGPARSDHRGEVGGAVPQQAHEAFALEAAELALEIVEVHTSENLE